MAVLSVFWQKNGLGPLGVNSLACHSRAALRRAGFSLMQEKKIIPTQNIHV